MFQARRFGKYTLVERIAVGGMAEVFKARAPGLRRPVVVKQILPQHARDAQFVEMFIEEAKLSVMLTHANIVSVYELGRIDDTYFLVMEHVHGRDLADVLQAGAERGFPMEPELAAFVAQQACAGLDYAHRRTDSRGRALGVVHRDLSPPNLLLSFEGDVKITDFGIAKAADRLTRTEAGVVRGTAGYMSPEQAAGLDVDARADVFSVGVLLWEMLTHNRLFVEKSELIKLRAGQRPAVEAPSRLAARVPSDLDAIVMRALAPNPDDRYASAGELGLALGRWTSTRRVAATPHSLAAYLRTLFRDELASARDTPTPPAMLDEHVKSDVQIFASQPVESPAGRGILWATVVVLLAFLGVLLWRGSRPPEAAAPAAAARRDVKYGDLAIGSTPLGAAVYQLLGHSPVEAPNLDIGQEHEVLVLGAGGREFRGRVTPGLWKRVDRGEGKDPDWRANARIDLGGASRGPLGDPGRPKHVPGTARIETAPPSEVWLLVGFTPKMRLDDLRIDRDYEFLVTHDGYEPRRVRIARGDWNPTGLDSTFATHVALKFRGAAASGAATGAGPGAATGP